MVQPAAHIGAMGVATRAKVSGLIESRIDFAAPGPLSIHSQVEIFVLTVGAAIANKGAHG